MKKKYGTVKRLRAAGFKLHAHWMANLPGGTPEADARDFEQLFEDPDFRPDELKLYPCLLVESAPLVKLHEQGLIYRAPYIVNWCPRCGTALSDLEAEHVDRESKLWSFAYPLADGSGEIAAPGDLAAQSRLVLPKIDGLFRQLGADLWDAVKTNVFNVEPGTQADWAEPALIRAGHFREPGPGATGISLPRLGMAWPPLRQPRKTDGA